MDHQSSTPQRQRGFSLTPLGMKKLQQRLFALEAQTGVKHNAARIAQQIQMIDPKGLHPTTVRKILRQETVDFSTLQVLFQALALDLAQADCEQPSPLKTVPTQQDWGGAPDVTSFFGRHQALKTVSHWIVADRCRLVTLLGMGGMGKTALSVKLAQQIQDQFTTLIWRSLRNVPPLEVLLLDYLQVLSGRREAELPQHLAGQISQLIDYLRQSRCLLILDNVESILEGGRPAGRYQSSCQGYGELLHQIASTHHQSCLILTSREKPQGIAVFEGEALSVRTYPLQGLDVPAGQDILSQKGFAPFTAAASQLVETYQGNPLALKIVATAIQDLFSGDIQGFLNQEQIAFSEIRLLLDQQFARLSSLEQQVLYWLAIARIPLPLKTLQSDLLPPATHLLEAIESIDRRSLLERDSTVFQLTLQPVIMEYVCDRFIDTVSAELQNLPLPKTALFYSHALIKADSPDFLRDCQIRLVLAPIADRLITRLGSPARLEVHLKQILSQLPSQPSYGAGNLLNLLVYFNIDLTGYDFSGLTVWQAFLQGINLHQVNLRSADLGKSVFTQTFGDIYDATFSPNGQWVATANADGIPRVWQVEDGKLLFAYQAHLQTVWTVAFSPDGQTLASGSFDQTILLWDLEQGKGQHILAGHQDRIWSIAFSPEGNILASGSNDRTLRLWDVSTGSCIHTFTGHRDGVTSLAYHPDGTLIASGSADQTLRLWHPSTGLVATLSDHTLPITCVAFSPDGQYLASSDAQTIRLWQVGTRDCQHVLENLTSVWSVAFSPNGQILGAGDRQHLKFWHVATGELSQAHTAYDRQIWSVAFSPKGQLLLACDKQKLGLWRFEPQPNDKGYVHRLCTLQGYTNAVWSVAISPDGQTLATGSTDHVIRLWEMDHQRCRQRHPQPSVRRVTFSPNGQKIASGSEDGSVYLWEPATGRQSTMTTRHEGKVWTVAFSPDGQILASGGADHQIHLWDVIHHHSLRTFSGHQSWVLSLAFSGSTLISSSADQTIKLWDLRSGNCHHTLIGHRGAVWSVSADAKILASASEDQTLRLWDLSTGEECQILKGHDSLVLTVQISPDGRYIASGSADNTVRVWDIQTGKCLQVLRGHTHSVWSVAFSPKGQCLVSGGQDGTLCLWAVESGQRLGKIPLERPYEGMDITGARGLTPSRRQMLHSLGAVEL